MRWLLVALVWQSAVLGLVWGSKLKVASWKVCCNLINATVEKVLEDQTKLLAGPSSLNAALAEGSSSETASQDVAVAEERGDAKPGSSSETAGQDVVVTDEGPSSATAGKDVALAGDGGAAGSARPWPPECDATLHYVFAKAENIEASLRYSCYHFERLVGEDETITNGTLSKATEVDQVAGGLLTQAVTILPRSRVTWMQWLVLLAMHLLCYKYYKPASSERGTAADCIDLVMMHVRDLFLDFDSWHDWDDQRIAASLFPRKLLGEFILAAPDNFTLVNAITERQDELWTRFVERAPEYASATTTLEQEESYGMAGLKAAESLVELLIEEEPKTAELLPKLGALIGPLAEERKPEPGAKEMGARRLRFGHAKMGAVTVNSGHYIPAWRRRLFEAVTDQSRAPGLPSGPFATPNSSDVVWARRCGSVVTWVDIPWNFCADIINSHWKAGAGIAVAGMQRNWMGEGISSNGHVCRIVMNRAVLRSTLDGALMGEDCKDRFGFGFDSEVGEAWKLFPLTYHASPLAQELVESVIVDKLLEVYYAAATKLGEAEAEQDRLRLLGELGETIASIFYFLSNIQPFLRGSAAATAVLHHALWMRLGSGLEASQSGGHAVLRCLGLWRNGSYPVTEDCHMVHGNTTWFFRHLYGVLLDHPTVRSPEQLSRCVLAALPSPCKRDMTLDSEVGTCLPRGPEVGEAPAEDG